jgi:hypothetical protein
MDRSLPDLSHTDVRIPEPTDGTVPWQDPAWLAETAAWIDGCCDAAGLERTGGGELRGRMWSAVIRVPVVGGDVWFKQNAPRNGFEPALLDALARWRPREPSALIAADPKTFRSLSHDVGERLDVLLRRDPDVRHLHTPLRRYTQLQRDLTEHVEDLLEIGVPDGRPDHIEGLLDDLLTYAPRGMIDEDVLRHVAAKLPGLRADAEELASLSALGAPATLDHQDLHPGNLLGDETDARPFDWGDATVGSPFGSILVLLRALPSFAPIDRADPEVPRLREVYLEPWRAETGLTAAELDRAVTLALRLTMVMRAHTWTRTLPAFRSSPEPWENAAFWLGSIGCADPVTVGLDA